MGPQGNLTELSASGGKADIRYMSMSARRQQRTPKGGRTGIMRA